ncbi:hypothetical protein ABG79_00149 [Caloramator mitchellensis]|uniref:DUF2179 domain-containing protein n=1 Tax=Caloramator mitchellensis TaxID=908809 RepID=A0A0R3JWM9_CALMK|nr:YitT family protein [Caloramator mitchellensis]KRQ87984.1 hypothetical protein ABG79_00149 [Caloramator mitchellensis]
MKIKKEEILSRLLIVILGCLISAIGINAFIVPHKLLSGGVAGLAIVIQYLTSIPSGFLLFILNIPIFLYGTKELDVDFIIFSILGVFLLSTMLIITRDINQYLAVKDILLSCVYGGVLNGIGVGLVLRQRASMGGTDIIAVTLKKRLGINVSTIAFIMNFVIVIIGMFISNIETGLYTLILMFISSRVMENVLQGFDRKKMIIIVTEKFDEISNLIMSELGRGVTFLHGEGAYTGVDKKVIYCIVTLNQLVKTKNIVLKSDPKAFLTIIDAAEVQGKGFRNFI